MIVDAVYLQFCHNNKKAQRYLLHGLECVVAMHQAQLISKIPHILKEMYDADLLEEEVIISWSEKVGSPCEVSEASKQLVGWVMKKQSLDSCIRC